MKRYPKYKYSGIDWIGEIPEHWNVTRLKYLFQEVNERTETGFETLLSMSKKYGLIPQSKLTDKPPSASTLVGYKLCKVGQIVMNKMQAWNGMFAIVSTLGIVSPDYTVFKQRQKLDNRYYIRLFTMPKMIDIFHQSSKGLGTGFFRLYTDEFNNIFIIYPPLSEQKTIARFLDHKLEQISHFISNKQRLIELLKEQKTAIINRAVTKGINHHASMEPSAIEWLGEIPAHWQQIKIKYVLHKIIDTEHKTAPFYEDGQYLVVRTSNIKDGMLDFTNAKYTNLDGFLEWTRRGKPKFGDILFTREAPAGEACLVPQGIDLCLGQRVVLFRVNHQKLNEEFGVHSIYGGIAAEFITLLSQGATVPHFNMSDIANIPLLLPSVNEQQQIVQYIKTETNKIDEVIAKAEKEIELIQEYRTTLISDAVTGKIDVRETSAVEPTFTAAAI
ncbi:restriction endonuclease subunit S [Nostoc sp.]|uniref:restriction endonuclease subunit S n=1 Tax=Nostoc sp. TaxID=1180 RepID=UPI002FFCCCA3